MKHDLEKRLINQFKNQFYKEMGYFPIVKTKTCISEESSHVILSEIESYFLEFLPTVYGGKLQLGGKQRNREIMELRYIFTYICRTLGFTLKQIATYMGGRDHATILNQYRKFHNLMETSPEFMEIYKKVINHIKKQKNLNDKLSTLVNFDTIRSES